MHMHVFVKCYSEWAIAGSMGVNMLVHVKHLLHHSRASCSYIHQSLVNVQVASLRIILTHCLVTIAVIACM